MENIWHFVTSFGIIPWFLMGLIGLILGWLIWGRGRKTHAGDLTIEGEAELRNENDRLRARIQSLEGDLSMKTSEADDLSGKLQAASLAAAPVAAVAASSDDDDETYALEWRNRYLAARVKYLESRLAEQPVAAVKKAAPKKAAPKKRAPAKKAAPKKAPAKKAAAPKVLYTDGPTDGAPDDLKLIKGIGPKFEKDLHGKGVYYFRQIAAWKKKDVEVVEKVIDSIPGRIGRDEWILQAKGFAKGVKPAAAAKKKPAAKAAKAKPAKAKAAAADKNAKYHDNVHKFDAKAKKSTVDNIVKYCGISLRSRDSSLVACSDPTEVTTVVKNFMVKKLGVDEEKGNVIVAEVCADMKSERFKNRVTFYYLCAKKARKLVVFA